MEDFLKMHEDHDIYLMFAKEFIRIVVGKKNWKHQCIRFKLSEFCSASGEAFCLLVLENNYMRWCGMIEADDYGDKGHTAPPPLYTNAGKSNRKNGTAKPFQGWTVEGYQRFDALYNLVKTDRAKYSRCHFEESLRNILQEENARKRQIAAEEEDDGEEVVYPSHDFDDVVRGGTRPSENAGEMGDTMESSKQIRHSHDAASSSDDSVVSSQDEAEAIEEEEEEEEEQQSEQEDQF
jgi:hypothetical protein